MFHSPMYCLISMLSDVFATIIKAEVPAAVVATVALILSTVCQKSRCKRSKKPLYHMFTSLLSVYGIRLHSWESLHLHNVAYMYHLVL